MPTDIGIDPILDTKIIYLCEKIADSNSKGVIFSTAKYATLLGMSQEEIARIIGIFEYKNFAERETVIEHGQDDEGRYEEFEYENLNFNKRGLKNLAQKIKIKQDLRETPLIGREELLRIDKQIRSIFDKDECIKIFAKFYPLEEVHMYFNSNKYSMTDIFLSQSYSKGIKLTKVLSEFLNPIYYDIGDDRNSKKLFEFINNVFSLYTDKEEHTEWGKESSKYTRGESSSSKLNIVYKSKLGKLSFDGTNFSVQLEGKECNSMDCLTESGFEVNVSWDQIYESFGEIETGDHTADKKVVRGAISRINKKTETYLRDTNPNILIEYKNNTYWLNHKVKKDN